MDELIPYFSRLLVPEQLGVQTAFGFAAACPASGPIVVAKTHRGGARCASHAAEPLLVKRMNGKVMFIAVTLDVQTSPVQQRIDLYQAIGLQLKDSSMSRVPPSDRAGCP